jgi:hypothetical protein
MRFSGKHENDYWHSLEIARVQHYELLFDAILKRIPWLLWLLTSIKSHHGTSRGLQSVNGPGGWEELEEVTRLTLDLAKLPPDTAVSMTQLAWAVGWDVLMRHDGAPSQLPRFQRPMLLGHYIQFLIAITQFWCPICLHRLLTDHDLRDMPAIYETMLRLYFDHFIPGMKGTARPGIDYLNAHYWYLMPMVLELGPEKRSGCFVHHACQHRSLN